MSKPVLSELEYNADDVAAAILSVADLSITNENLGVTDARSELSYESGWALNVPGVENLLYCFNGFAFISLNVYHAGSEPASGETLMTIDNSDYHPVEKTSFPTNGYQGDTAQYLLLHSRYR